MLWDILLDHILPNSLLMVLVKALLTSTSFATGFEDGPIFPLLFLGGTLGLALSKILTFIPEGVAREYEIFAE
jgi:H+/Cl- antiporter ClcA